MSSIGGICPGKKLKQIMKFCDRSSYMNSGFGKKMVTVRGGTNQITQKARGRRTGACTPISAPSAARRLAYSGSLTMWAWPRCVLRDVLHKDPSRSLWRQNTDTNSPTALLFLGCHSVERCRNHQTTLVHALKFKL